MVHQQLHDTSWRRDCQLRRPQPHQKLPIFTRETLVDELAQRDVIDIARHYRCSTQAVYAVVARLGLSDYAKQSRRDRVAAQIAERKAAARREREQRRRERGRYVPGLVPPLCADGEGDIEIPASKGRTFLVSAVDADLARAAWHSVFGANSRAYARMKGQGRQGGYILMHRLILARMMGAELPDSIEPDHINGNTLDNRRSNLRPATRSHNMANKGLMRTNRSGYKGVSFYKRLGKWRAAIKHRMLGYFATPEEAARAYDKAAIEIYGPYAKTNASIQEEAAS